MDRLNGNALKAMFESGCNNLVAHKNDIDALNVFPVPDGDTGTNMSLTFTNGVSEMNKSGSDAIPVITKTFSRGLLMGARGNSGVILSQIFRGFYQAVKEKEELGVEDVHAAFTRGKELAYKAVMRPVEGTILTVIRESVEKAEELIKENPEMPIEEYLDAFFEASKVSLDHTPELLPVLKEAHVVDSGGSGLVKVIEGFNAYLHGNPITKVEESETSVDEVHEKSSGYRAEFVLKMNSKGKQTFNEDRVRKMLDTMGNNITLLNDGEELKLKINTMSPGEILTLGQRYGDFKKIQIENIQGELSPSIIEEEVVEERKKYGIIAVSAGEGLDKIFKDYRVDVVVSGGQTMNPSTADFVEAIEKLNADNIYLLPNNSNIVMSCEQARDVTKDKNVVVLRTTSIPQGISACISFNPDEEVEANTEAMQEAIDYVKSGSITYAVKDTSIDGKEIKTGDYMGILNKDIVVVKQGRLETIKELLNLMIDEDSEVATIFKGQDVEDTECEEIRAYLEENFDIEVDIEDGGQPVYSYYIGVE